MKKIRVGASKKDGRSMYVRVEEDSREYKNYAARKHAAVLAVAEILRQSFQVRVGETITEDLARERANNAAQAVEEYIQPLQDKPGDL